MGFFDGVNAAVAQVNPFDGGKTWSSYYSDKARRPQFGAPSGTNVNLRGTAPAKTGGSSTGLDQNYLNTLAGLNARIASLQAEANAAPRFYAYDTQAARSAARAKATADVNPRFQELFARYAADFNRRRGEANTGAQMGRENADIELKNLQEGNAIEQGRTTEDVAGALYNVNNQEQQFQMGEGRAFDQQKREMEAKTAASGLATSGLGGQAIQSVQEDRNIASAAQADAFQQERKMKEQFKTRTFEDLMRSDVLGKEKNTQTKKQIDFDLNKMINDLAFDEKITNDKIREDQMRAIQQAESDYYDVGVESFINSLAGRGARAQDILLARQTYK